MRSVGASHIEARSTANASSITVRGRKVSAKQRTGCCSRSL